MDGQDCLGKSIVWNNKKFMDIVEKNSSKFPVVVSFACPLKKRGRNIPYEIEIILDFLVSIISMVSFEPINQMLTSDACSCVFFPVQCRFVCVMVLSFLSFWERLKIIFFKKFIFLI
jgi:hypothetical protein